MTSEPAGSAESVAYLRASKISKHFGGVQALDKVSMTIGCGKIHSLIGENGCGKSTFIKILAGVHQPDAGRITIHNRFFRHLRPIDAIHAGIQVIYQDFSLFPNLRVAENIALNTQLEHRRLLVNWSHVRTVAAEAVERLGLKIDLRKFVAELSVADKQLVAIARALVHEGRLIIMDEPTAALTSKEVDLLFEIVKGLQHKGISVLFVSHKLNEVLEISDEVSVLRNGRKVADGPVSQFDHDRLTQCMTGRELTYHRSLPPKGHTEVPLLQVKGLTRDNSINDISFELYQGEIVGLTGLLGSGRTELALSLFGMKPVHAGTILMDGGPVSIRNVGDAMRLGIAYVPEDRLTEGLFLERSVQINVVAATLRSLRNKTGLLDSHKTILAARRWVENLAIKTGSTESPVQNLSGGNQQKVVLAKWLAREPRVLILNRSTAGVDIGAKADIHARIRQLADQHMGLLVISDDLPELVQLCHRILLMHRGRLIDGFQTNDCTEETLLSKLGQLK